MIYEIRTYNVRPGMVGEYEARFQEAFSVRAKYSGLYGYWHTEIGPLNQLVHIWPYESMQQRIEVRRAAAKDPSGVWPPHTNDLLISQENDIIVPIKGMTEWTGPQQFGEIYELRMYTYPGGEIGKVAERFAEAYAGRAGVYPVGGIWTSDLGNLNRLYQLFPYKDWNHREEVRAELRAKSLWPPNTGASALTQLVRHLIPTAFSPLH